MIRQFAIASVLTFVSLSVQAEVKLPGLLSSHAVLQRERPIHIWGWATPKTDLSVEFHRQILHTHADEFGHWEVWLAPEKAGGSYSLTIRGDGAPKVIEDLLVGDVWLASGQSNMEMGIGGVNNAQDEIAQADYPNIRLFTVPKRISYEPTGTVALPNCHDNQTDEGHWPGHYVPCFRVLQARASLKRN